MKRLSWGLVLLGVGLLSGCIQLWQEALDIRTYLLSVERNIPPVEKPMAALLEVERVVVLPPFNSRNLIIRTSEAEYAPSYYSEFLVTPEENVRSVVFNWFAQSGLFTETVLQSRRKKAFRLAVTVLEMAVDARKEAAPETVLSMQVALVDGRPGQGERVLMSKKYTCASVVASVEPEPVIQSWSQSLQEILTACEADLILIISDSAE